MCEDWSTTCVLSFFTHAENLILATMIGHCDCAGVTYAAADSQRAITDHQVDVIPKQGRYILAAPYGEHSEILERVVAELDDKGQNCTSYYYFCQ